MPQSQYKYPARIQSLLFDREHFTPGQAKAWAKKHGFKHGDVDTSTPKIRLRQFDPSEAAKGTYGTKEIAMGVKAVFAGRKGNPRNAKQNYGDVIGKASSHARLARNAKRMERIAKKDASKAMRDYRKTGDKWQRSLAEGFAKEAWEWNEVFRSHKAREKEARKREALSKSRNRKNPPFPHTYALQHENGAIIQLNGNESDVIRTFEETMSEAGGSAVLFKARPRITASVKQGIDLVPIRVAGGQLANPQENHPYLRLERIRRDGETWWVVVDKKSGRVRYMTMNRRDAARRAREM